MFDYFLAHRPAGGWPPPLQTRISAEALLPARTIRGFLESFGIKIHSFYGASECGGISVDRSRQDGSAGAACGDSRQNRRNH
jgi:acyl-coenzyme A synthetase/AMP-(fatty) acid ligase